MKKRGRTRIGSLRNIGTLCNIGRSNPTRWQSLWHKPQESITNIGTITVFFFSLLKSNATNISASLGHSIHRWNNFGLGVPRGRVGKGALTSSFPSLFSYISEYA